MRGGVFPFTKKQNSLRDKGFDLNKTLFSPKSEAFEALQYLVTRLEQLGKMRSGENNHLQASLNKATSKSIKTMLRAIDKQAQLVEDEIKTLVDNDKQLKHPVKLLLSIDGIGNKTAWAIIAHDRTQRHFLRFAFLL
jgi:transposase